MQISFGCSTVCNARCTNCTHDQMVKNGELIPRIVELQEMYYWVRKFKLLSVLYHINVTNVDPVGLREPLTNPHIVEILKYIKTFFPDARLGLNTNISLLKGKLAREIAKLELDHIYLSLSYFDKNIYEKEIGLNYDDTIKNIRDFIQICDEEKTKTSLYIHIFNNKLNTEDDIRRFVEYFQPLLHKKDLLQLYQYLELSQKQLKGRGLKRKRVHPCGQLWHVLTATTDGTVYPCCMGVWKKYDPYLSIGNITDFIPDIIENLINLRKKQMKGDFGSCLECDTLYNNIEFMLPMLCYDKKKSIRGDIQYILKKGYLLTVLKKMEKKCFDRYHSSLTQLYRGSRDNNDNGVLH